MFRLFRWFLQGVIHGCILAALLYGAFQLAAVVDDKFGAPYGIYSLFAGCFCITGVTNMWLNWSSGRDRSRQG